MQPAESASAPRVSPWLTSSVRLVSFNVHCWRNSSGDVDGERIVSFLESLDPHILALQEVPLTSFDSAYGYLDMLATKLEMQYDFKSDSSVQFGNVLMWRRPVTAVARHGGWLSRGGSWRRNYFVLSATAHGAPLSVCVTHLDHVDEDRRLKQLAQIRRDLTSSPPLIILGDLNALYEADYNAAHFARIAASRRAALIEPPRVDLMRSLTQAYQVFPEQFKPTCPYGTRVDYALLSRAGLASSQWVVSHAEITDIVASDHAAVVVDLRKK